MTTSISHRASLRAAMCRAAVLLAALLLSLPLAAVEPIEPALTPPEPQWNRLYDADEVTDLIQRYAAAYPDWLTLESLGLSAGGRDIWLLTLNNPATGDVLGKPAIYVDGNTHANEVQGTEATLYTLDFVLKNYGRLDRVTELLDRAVFYLVPMVNPDGRALWFAGPSTSGFPRTVLEPVDDDRDGRVDEDGFDDLDGDGEITQMRKRVTPGEGTHRLHDKDPRILVEAGDEELGDWVLLGAEGIDNDGDGNFNEDTIGYVDPNRTWGWDWQPPYVQIGAGRYPLAIPESRAIANWAMDRPNIAAAQSFHNAGGMILRPPSAKSQPKLTPEDLAAYDLIAEEGERMLPGYRYLVVWKDLYTTFGATDDHFLRIHGAITFTNEITMSPADLNDDGEITEEEEMRFNDVLTLGRQMVDWKEIEHPQYGTVEVGGMRHDVGRVPEGWMLEEETHRNSTFVLFHAHHLPMLRFGEPDVRSLGGGLWHLEIPVVNERAIPSMLGEARRNKLHRPDLATVSGASGQSVEVVTSGIVEDRWAGQVKVQEHRPERLMVPGVDGYSARRLFFLVRGEGEVVVRYDSLKGGQIEHTIDLVTPSSEGP